MDPSLGYFTVGSTKDEVLPLTLGSLVADSVPTGCCSGTYNQLLRRPVTA